LRQNNGRPATVNIYNLPASPKMDGYGTLIFAVPSMADALSGMEDEQDFVVSIEGNEVFRMSWKDGGQAPKHSSAMRRPEVTLVPSPAKIQP